MLLVVLLALLPWQARQEVDRWIERLPLIERQWHYDAENEVIWEPEVLAMRDYLDGGGLLSDAQWRLALVRSGAIRVRERWPVQEPFAISVEVPAWLKNSKLTVEPVRSDFTSAQATSTSGGCGNCAMSSGLRARYQTIGVLALGPQVLELRITVERIPAWRRRGAPAQSPKILWQGILAPTVEGVHAIEEVLPGASDPELDAAVRRALDIHRVEEVSLFGKVAHVPELVDTSVSLHVEVRRGNEVHDEATLALQRRNAFVQSVILDVPDRSLSGWNLHVRGVPESTLREWNARRHWNGELVIPLEELRRP